MARVYADEGGYTNDPQDPGGPTIYGITIFDGRKYWKPNATAEDMRTMPKSVAADIYRKHYAVPMRYDDLPAGFDYSVLDAAINSGVGRAPQWAGRALGIPVKTINDVVVPANGASDKVDIIQKYWGVRLAFLHSLKTWGHFGNGWGRRVTNGEAAAVKMWLTFGAALSPAAVDAKMKQESTKALAKAKKSAGAAAGSAAGSSSPATPAVDVSHFSLGGKVVIGILIAAGIALTIYFIHRAIVHSQRADAYAKA